MSYAEQLISSTLVPYDDLDDEIVNIYNSTGMEKTYLLQDIFTKKLHLDNDNMISLLYYIRDNGDISREDNYYINSIICNTDSLLSIAMLLNESRLSNVEIGVGCYQYPYYGTIVFNFLRYDKEARRDFYSWIGYVHYLQYCYLEGELSLAGHKIDLEILVNTSESCAQGVLDLVAVTDEVHLIKHMLQESLRIYKCSDKELKSRINQEVKHELMEKEVKKGDFDIYSFSYPDNTNQIIDRIFNEKRGEYPEFFSSYRTIVETLGTINKDHKDIEEMLDNLSVFEELSKHIEKARKKQERLISGKAKKYKNPLLKCTPFVREYSGIGKYYKDISFRRWQDFQDKLDDPSFDQEEIREFENNVRVELGLPRIGEGWKNETALYNFTVQLLSKLNISVLHHHRPSWLKPQELDIYFEIGDMKVGIEYQGIQHYQPVTIFGGKEGFMRTKERDDKKKGLCLKHDVHLIHYKYSEDVTEANVRKKLSSELGIVL